MTTPIVFFDIGGPDVDKLARFYGEVFGWGMKPGPFPGTWNIDPGPAIALGGTIRQDPRDGSAQSMPNLIYMGVPDVTETLRRIEAAGGTVHAPRFEVTGVVVLGLFKDPAGNPGGLVEMDGDRPKAP